MTGAREIIAQAVAENLHWSVEAVHNFGIADAVLSALREHWTSQAEMRRIIPFVDNTTRATWIVPAEIRAVIAALFEEEP